MSEVDDTYQDKVIALAAAGKGTLHVRAFVDGTETSGIFVEVLNQTPPLNGVTPWTVSLDPGNYFVRIAYMDQSDTKPATITSGQPTEVVFYLAAEEWRLSLSVSSTNVKVGDPVTFSGKLEKKCPDGAWYNPNWLCAENRQRPDPIHFRIFVMPHGPDQHTVDTDDYGNYSITFPFTQSGDFLAEASTNIIDYGTIEAKDGTIHVEAGPPPEYSISLDEVTNYCDISRPQIILRGRALVDSSPAPSGNYIGILVDGVWIGTGGNVSANGRYRITWFNPTKGTHSVQTELWIDSKRVAKSNAVQYTCNY